MAKQRNEYQRIRDNIMRGIRRQRAKGAVIYEKAPLTPKQKGYKSATSRDINELITWGKTVLNRLKAEDDVDRLLRIAHETNEESKKKYNTNTNVYDGLVANESSVYVYNFQRSLQTKKYADGANKVQDWYVKMQKILKSDNELADFLKRAEKEGISVDTYVKYADESYADHYISDMTERLAQERYISEDQVRDLLTGVSDMTEQAQQFFDDFLGGLD